MELSVQSALIPVVSWESKRELGVCTALMLQGPSDKSGSHFLAVPDEPVLTAAQGAGVAVALHTDLQLSGSLATALTHPRTSWF